MLTPEQKERKKAYNREWQKANRDKVSAAGAKWRAANLDIAAARSRRWYAKNRDKVREWKRQQKHRRRAGLRNAEGSFAAAEFAALGNVCAYCCREGKMTADHIVPLSRGGSNWISNIAPACSSCNGRKWTMTGGEFREKLRRLDRSAREADSSGRGVTSQPENTVENGRATDAEHVASALHGLVQREVVVSHVESYEPCDLRDLRFRHLKTLLH